MRINDKTKKSSTELSKHIRKLNNRHRPRITSGFSSTQIQAPYHLKNSEINIGLNYFKKLINNSGAKHKEKS
jgi:subtilase family serine protease